MELRGEAACDLLGALGDLAVRNLSNRQDAKRFLQFRRRRVCLLRVSVVKLDSVWAR